MGFRCNLSHLSCFDGICIYLFRAILKLKMDHELRTRLGANGRQNVSKCSIHQVVQDLVQWYHLGIKNRHRRGYGKATVVLSLLSFFVPFAIASLAGYDLLVSISLFIILS